MSTNEAYEKFRHLDHLLHADSEGAPDDVSMELCDTLAWMVADMNHRREQTGLDIDVKSPQMQIAERLLVDLETGKIECRRIA